MKPIFSFFFYFFITHFSFSQQWHTLGNGLNLDNYTSGSAITTYNNELYFAADNLVLKWNGTDYDTLGKRFDNRINDLEFYNGDLYASGGFRWYNYYQGGPQMHQIAKWNGTDWENVGTGLNGTAFSLKVYNNKLYVTGQFTTAGGISANYIAAWNGISWEALGSGLSYYEAALDIYNSELYVFGMFSMAGGISVNNVAKWNGSSWSAAGDIYGGTGLKDSEVFNNELYLSDATLSTIEFNNLNYPVLKWNNTSWSFAGDPGGQHIGLAMDVYNNNLYGIKKVTGGSIFIYKNSTWEPVSFPTSGIDTALISKSIVLNGELYIVGGIYLSSSPTVNVGIAKISLSGINNLIDFSSNTKSIEIYPNPANDVINLKSFSPLVQKIELYTMSGILIYSHLPTESINIDKLSSGIYLMRVISEDEVRIAKFIKE